MVDVTSLLGLTFKEGERDCFTLIRNYYSLHDIHIRDYARPVEWWDHGLNLYMDNFYNEGFRPLNVHPREWKQGDLILMAIQAPVANHSAVLLENGNILHHLYNCNSRIESYNRPLFRDTTVGVLRHPKVAFEAPPPVMINLLEEMPDEFRQRVPTNLLQ